MFDYSSADARWRRLRERVLRRDGYRCRNCARYGRSVPASTVHHAWPAEDFPELQYDARILVSLCDECHNACHDRLTRELTTLGEFWKRKTIPPGV